MERMTNEESTAFDAPKTADALRDGVDERAVRAQSDPQVLDDLISDYRPFILASASRVCGRPVDPDNDDEYSTAMLAFYEAVRGYAPSRGAFLSFARSVIRTRLIDGFRKAGRRPPTLSLDDDGEDEEDYRSDPTYAAASEIFERETQVRERRDEIARFSDELAAWGFTFRDLADASPKAAKTKAACGAVVGEMMRDGDLRDAFLRSRQLPLAALCLRSGVPRKIAERHRRFIVAAILALDGDYPYMAEHLRWMRKRD